MFMKSAAAPASGADAVLEKCISQIAEGDLEALARFYAETQSAVYCYALSILKSQSDAEDVMQDVFIQVWKGAGRYRAAGKPMAWVLVITRNLAMDRLRREKNVLPFPEEELRWESTGDFSVSEEDRLTLRDILRDLGDEERQIVVLHSVTGLRHREIAEIMQMPLATVLSKYNRAIKKLRLAWEEAE